MTDPKDGAFLTLRLLYLNRKARDDPYFHSAEFKRSGIKIELLELLGRE